MAVESLVSEKSYKPGAAMAAEPLTGIKFLNPDEIAVELQLDGETERTPLTRGLHYTLGGNGSIGGGTITATGIYAADDLFHVRRETSRLVPAVASAHQPIPSADLQRELDRSAMARIDQDREIARAIQAERGLPAPPLGEIIDGQLLGMVLGKLVGIESDAASTPAVVAARDAALAALAQTLAARNEAQDVVADVSAALATGTVSDLVGTRIYTSKALLDADLVPADDLYALVVGDPTPANNDLYKKNGATGLGAWDGPLGLFAAASAAATAAAEDAAASEAAAATTVSNGTTGTLVTVAQGWDLYTRELSPGSNRFVKVRMQFYVDGPNLASVARMIGAWLCEKTGPDTYADVIQILGNGPFEVLATETGQIDAMGTLQLQSSAGSFYHHNGNQVADADMVGIKPFRTFEFVQRTALYAVVGHAGLTSLRSRHVFVPDGFDYEFEYYVGEVHSLAHLVIGKLDLVQDPLRDGLFDTVRRGPEWTVSHDISDPVAPYSDGASVFKVSGEEGVSIELSIAPGTEWGRTQHTANIDTEGRIWFDFHDAPYSAALEQFSSIKGTIRVRFGYNGA